MNRQVIKDVIKVSVDEPKVYYVIETKDKSYNAYNGVYYDDNHVEFTDDYDNEINLSYEDIISIRVSNF